MPAKQTKAEVDEKVSIKEKRTESFVINYPTIVFKNQHLVKVDGSYVPLTREVFQRLAYQLYGGLNMTALREVEDMVRATAPIRDDLARFVALGDGSVWDMALCDYTTAIANEDCVFATRHYPDPTHTEASITYIRQLANDHDGVAEDIWQTLAPVIMDKKPTGVIWYRGWGRNGKSGLLEETDGVLHRLFGAHLSSVTLHAIEDERDAPRLNGNLANIVDDSSEGRIDDSRTYKAIGTHQPFPVHKFHSQDGIMIDGNLHHIFATNNMPVFGDKSQGARRRTVIIKFENEFELDGTFYDRTFTDDFLNGFLYNMTTWAKKLKEWNYGYRFSAKTLEDKMEYDSVVNTAESFAEYFIKEQGGVMFESYSHIMTLYNWWCDRNSLVALGKMSLSEAFKYKGFKRNKITVGDSRKNVFKLHGYDEEYEPMAMFDTVYVRKDYEAEEVTPIEVIEQGRFRGL